MARKQDRTIASETEAAIDAAEHLTDQDKGVVEVLRRLAGQADHLVANGGMSESGKFDNVTIPTYLRYAEALQMTPASRAKMAEQKPAGGSRPASALDNVRSIVGGKAG